MREEAVVEVAQAPAVHGEKLFHLAAAEQVAHRHGGCGAIPVRVGRGAGICEADVFHEMPRRGSVRHSSGLERDVHEDAVRAPEGIVELDEPRVRGAVDLFVHAQLLAPERPALVKNRVREHAAQVAPVAVLHDELQVVARIRLVRAGEFEPEMLGDLGLA